MTHTFPVRVYYEDTDLAGVVYYANYLKFIERARSEYLRDLGVDQVAMKRDGIAFVVRRVEADFLVPAVFDDMLTVQTQVRAVTGARVVLGQDVLRDEVVLFAAEVTIATFRDDGRAVRLPADVRRLMGPDKV